jgi:predicted dehydrogenase
MVDQVRWGILATGGIADSFAEDLARLSDARMVAVGSRSLEAASTFALRHNIPQAYGTWQELAEDPEVDVIYVATPHSAHLAASMVCLAAGKAVVCEKPLTLDEATSAELITTARTAGLFFMEAMWMRVNPVIRRVKELIDDGAIGEITNITADFCVAGPFPPGHRMRAPELGGGALLDLGVYPVTFAHLFLGVPERVHAVAALTPEGTDQNTALTLSYASGALASLQCGFVGESEQAAVITGTRARIEIPRHFYRPTRYTLARADNDREKIQLPIRGRGLLYEAEEAMRCLRAGLTESPLIPHEGTLEVMRTLDAARAQIGVVYP